MALLTEVPDAVTPPPSSGATAGGPAGSSSRGRGERRDKIPKASSKIRRPATTTGAVASDRVSKETEAIGVALGQLLSAPGMIFGMIGDPFLGDQVQRSPDGSVLLNAQGKPTVIPGHFTRTGPAVGMQLAQASERNPQLRKLLKAAMGGDSMALVLLGVVAYAAPPLVYLLTANTSPLRHTFQVPPRPRKASHAESSAYPGEPEDGAPADGSDQAEG